MNVDKTTEDTSTDDTVDNTEETNAGDDAENQDDSTDNQDNTDTGDDNDSAAPSEDDDKDFHKNPKFKDYTKRQTDKAFNEGVESGKRQATESKPTSDDSKLSPEEVKANEAVDSAKDALAKVLESGTSGKEVAEAQANLNDAQFNARDTAQTLEARRKQESSIKLDTEVTEAKAKLRGEGVKNVDELDQYVKEVDKSGTVEQIFRRALLWRDKIGSAKKEGEEVGRKKRNSTSPAKPSSDSKNSDFKPGMSFDDIERASKNIK